MVKLGYIVYNRNTLTTHFFERAKGALALINHLASNGIESDLEHGLYCTECKVPLEWSMHADNCTQLEDDGIGIYQAIVNRLKEAS